MRKGTSHESLNSFAVGHLLLGMWLPLRIKGRVSPVKTPLEKTEILIASGYLTIGDGFWVREGVRVHFFQL